MHERMGYEDCVPFSPQGIERWVRPTGTPQLAAFFYGGQFHDSEAGGLSQSRYEYFAGRENRHVFDIEGDWRGREIPAWLRPATMTAMNVLPKHRDWRMMARPPSSRLLVSLARGPMIAFSPPAVRSFYFQGQPDSQGLRERMAAAAQLARVPADIAFNPFWGARLDPTDGAVRSYCAGLERSAFALCPAGEGQATMRMYEACAYGRVPVVISDALWMWEDLVDTSWCFRISPHSDRERIAEELALIYSISQSEMEERGRQAWNYFQHVVRNYFADPMREFLIWTHLRCGL